MERAAILVGAGLLLGSTACLEKQPDDEVTINGGGRIGGVSVEGELAGPAKMGDLAAMPVGQAAAAEHHEVAHEDKPAGYGSEPATAPPGAPGGGAEGADAASADAPGADAASAGGEGAPVGVPEAVPHQDFSHTEHQHIDRPPGFGREDAVASAPPGEPGGAGGGALPSVASPFERQYADKPMVLVKGTLSVSGDSSGVADIDCFVPDEESPAKRRFVNKIKARIPGTYEMKVPSGYGALIVSAFLDLDGDGPDTEDPQGAYPETLQIASEDIEGVDITLTAGRAPQPEAAAGE